MIAYSVFDACGDGDEAIFVSNVSGCKKFIFEDGEKFLFLFWFESGYAADCMR